MANSENPIGLNEEQDITMKRNSIAGIGVGVALGVVIGLALENVALGIGFGVVLGIPLGIAYQKSDGD
jgi:hypothetical protein